ncbi:MAG TPA: GYF domain-containing protein [Kofleriaceae bacterium]|nr:GYF domain-containing protein [Kofleriaceae bacterium]
MKFLCDRCKTRYSIGDERVRGKILKIRCKTCSNVITVREGMSIEPDAAVAPAYANRPKKPTTMAPEALDERSELTHRPGAGPSTEPLGPAKQAARPRGAARPPAALEEEWYVSIDGVQEGPFSLADAQAWVAGKAFDADLHCWSEGFDDWLPIDKVSHFRGLRKRPAPPPMPRAPMPSRPAVPDPRDARRDAGPDDDPRPLFAATMASLERDAPSVASSGLDLPPPRPPERVIPFGPATPPRTNGAGIPPGGAAPGAPAAKDAQIRPRPGDKVGAGFPAMPARPADDPFGLDELVDSATQIDVNPFETEAPVAPRLAPRVEARPGSSDAALTSPHLPASSTLQGTGANPATTAAAVAAAAEASSAVPEAPGDGDLAFGEVSRVVKLADLSRTPLPAERPPAAPRVGGTTGSAARIAGPSPRLRSTGASAALIGLPPGPGPMDDELGLAIPPDTSSHRRGLIALLAVALLVVLGVAGALVLFVFKADGPGDESLGPVHDIDTSRPEDPITHRPIDRAGSGAQPPGPLTPMVPRILHPRSNPPQGSGHDAETVRGDSLRGDEIEDVARKYQDLTQRCYMRSQRGANSILVGDVKKIAVTLVINKDGNVDGVELSEHGDDNLGKCLSTLIRSWKFRQSPGGRFRFSLNFVDG